MASSIGERIRELRTTLRLTQDQFGNKIGVKNGVVSAWEKGSAPVPDGRVRIIRDEYNASIDWILKGEGEMFQESTEDPNAKRDAALEYALSLIRKLPAVERNDAVEFIRELVRRCDDDYVSALRKPSSKNAQSDVPEIVIASADDDFDEAYEDEYDYDDSYDEDYGDYEAYDEYEGYDDEYEQDSWRSNGPRRSYITDYSEPNKGFVGTLKDMGKNFSGASELANKAFSNLTDFRVLRVLIIVGVAVWVLNSLYTPVRNYYVANRQLDALQATYDAVTKESDDIRSELEYLQTHEGIEDVARTRGFVEPGDTKVIVEGLQDKGDTFNQPYHPTDTKVVEERTWYVEMLDNLFGYKPEA